MDSANRLMSDLGLDPSPASPTDAARAGQNIAALVLEYALNDGANQEHNFEDNSNFANVELGLEEAGFGNPNQEDPNNWQPLIQKSKTTCALRYSFLERALTFREQKFLTPHWRSIKAFSDDPQHPVIDVDAAAPALFGTDQLKSEVVALIKDSSWLSPGMMPRYLG
jgi:hypothetical protein